MQLRGQCRLLHFYELSISKFMLFWNLIKINSTTWQYCHAQGCRFTTIGGVTLAGPWVRFDSNCIRRMTCTVIGGTHTNYNTQEGSVYSELVSHSFLFAPWTVYWLMTAYTQVGFIVLPDWGTIPPLPCSDIILSHIMLTLSLLPLALWIPMLILLMLLVL